MFTLPWLRACDGVQPEDCLEDEVYREEMCLRCGNVGDCARTCDTGFGCEDGVEVSTCDGR
jgi:hypothetical protein